MRKARWRSVLRSMLFMFLACMSSFANELGVPGNHSFVALLELRRACAPIVVEYLFLSHFAHDQSLIRYIASFPGSLWPDLSRIPATTLYILWSPLHDKVYAGRTINFVRRHLDHTHRIHCPYAPGQIPAYFAFREHASHDILPSASFFMLPIVAVTGGTSEAVVAERVLLGNFSFKLNTPHVYKHFPESRVGRRRGGLVIPLSSKRTLGRSTRPLARHTKTCIHTPLRIPTKPRKTSTAARILDALCFDRRDRNMKAGLKLLFVVRSRSLICHIFHQVHRWSTLSQRAHALKFVRKRAKQLHIQLPLECLHITLPWCGTVQNIEYTKTSVQDFALQMLSNGFCQPSLFNNGRVRCKVRWKATPSLLDKIRTAPRFNRHLDDDMVCSCCCMKFVQQGWPCKQALDGTSHVCARQSEINWPKHLAFLGKLSVQTRTLPSPEQLFDWLQSAFLDMARKLADPFGTSVSHHALKQLAVCQARDLLSKWNLFEQKENSSPGLACVSSDAVLEIQRICKGLFIEAIDKNTSEFVCMCPRMYHLLACALFQAYPSNTVLVGVSYLVQNPFSGTHTLTSAPKQFEIGEKITVSNILTDRLVFDNSWACSSDVVGKVMAIPGTNFSYDLSSHHWLQLEDLTIPGLEDALQPKQLNKRFSRLWAKMLSSRTESWGMVRALPKQKNLSLGRPLGDQSSNPLALLCRVLGRVLHLCMDELPKEWHFDRPTHAAVVQSLREIRDRPYGSNTQLSGLENTGLFILSRDVDNGYMRIQHEEAIKAWKYIHAAMMAFKRREAWVSPYAQGGASWIKQKGQCCVRFSLENVEPLFAFLFRHMQFSLGAKQGWQTEGIMMGQAAGGAIFRLVLVAHEMKAMTSVEWQTFQQENKHCSFSGIRFVDDIRIAIVYPLSLGHEWASARARQTLSFVYPSHLVMKDDAVNPFVGMKLLPKDSTLQWCAYYKPLGETVHYASRYTQALLPWNSFSTPETFTAVLFGGFSRCKHLSSNIPGLVDSIAHFMAVAQHAGYPIDFIHQKLKSWCKTYNLKVFEECTTFKTNDTWDRLTSASFTDPEITFPVGMFHGPSF